MQRYRILMKYLPASAISAVSDGDPEKSIVVLTIILECKVCGSHTVDYYMGRLRSL